MVEGRKYTFDDFLRFNKRIKRYCDNLTKKYDGNSFYYRPYDAEDLYQLVCEWFIKFNPDKIYESDNHFWHMIKNGVYWTFGKNYIGIKSVTKGRIDYNVFEDTRIIEDHINHDMENLYKFLTKSNQPKKYLKRGEKHSKIENLNKIIVDGLLLGKTPKEIGKSLKVSDQFIRNHLKAIKIKFENSQFKKELNYG